MRQKSFVVASCVLMFSILAAAQGQTDKSKRPSPPGTASATLNGKNVTIDYSRPYLKGRKIGSEIVPYGKIWRTGANEATALSTETDLDIAGTNVPAGKYTIYTLPSEGTWKLIINKQTGQWGTEYDESKDLARIDLQKSQLQQPVEQFTISFDKKGNDAADLALEWGTTKLTAPIKTK